MGQASEKPSLNDAPLLGLNYAYGPVGRDVQRYKLRFFADRVP